jgi:hypothetical protein
LISTVWPRCRSGAVGSNPGLDAQRAPGFEFFDEFGLDQQFVGAALDQRQLGVDIDHVS